MVTNQEGKPITPKNFSAEQCRFLESVMQDLNPDASDFSAVSVQQTNENKVYIFTGQEVVSFFSCVLTLMGRPQLAQKIANDFKNQQPVLLLVHPTPEQCTQAINQMLEGTVQTFKNFVIPPLPLEFPENEKKRGKLFDNFKKQCKVAPRPKD